VSDLAPGWFFFLAVTRLTSRVRCSASFRVPPITCLQREWNNPRFSPIYDHWFRSWKRSPPDQSLARVKRLGVERYVSVEVGPRRAASG